MKKSRDRIEQEKQKEQDSTIYKDEITPKMLQYRSNFVLERSYHHIESLRDGRVSYGMNEKIEKMEEDASNKEK